MRFSAQVLRLMLPFLRLPSGFNLKEVRSVGLGLVSFFFSLSIQSCTFQNDNTCSWIVYNNCKLTGIRDFGLCFYQKI